MNLAHYELLAQIFSYPAQAFFVDVRLAVNLIKERYPGAAEDAERFYAHLPHDSLDGMQELFTRSFDIQAITTLDVGYVLFGEDYRRGELLSNLNREHAKVHNDCGLELADHLPNLLRLIAKSGDGELARELVGEILVHALHKMIGEFAPGRRVERDRTYQKYYKTLIESSEDIADIYGHALKTLLSVLKQDFQIREEVLGQFEGHSFLRPVGVEMTTERSVNG